MKRRNAVLFAGLGISALALPTWYYNFKDLEYDPLIASPDLLSKIWDKNTIKEIGKAYRAQFQKEDSQRTLVPLLSKLASIDSAKTIEAFREQIKDDYTKGNIVVVNSWVLSKTEARQCALFSLTQQ